MRAFVVVSGLFALAAFSPNYREYADNCEVTVAQMRQIFDEVSRMSPYLGKRVGQCDLIVEDARDVSVIPPEIQKHVEETIARQKAEANQ